MEPSNISKDNKKKTEKFGLPRKTEVYLNQVCTTSTRRYSGNTTNKKISCCHPMELLRQFSLRLLKWSHRNSSLRHTLIMLRVWALDQRSNSRTDKHGSSLSKLTMGSSIWLLKTRLRRRWTVSSSSTRWTASN